MPHPEAGQGVIGGLTSTANKPDGRAVRSVQGSRRRGVRPRPYRRKRRRI